jgi:hypothetical protein
MIKIMLLGLKWVRSISADSVVTWVLMIILGGVILSIPFIIGMITYPYAINSWLVFAKKEPIVQWWVGGLLGYVSTEVGVVAALLTWLIMLFIA